MNKDVKDYYFEELGSYCITAYLAALTGRLEAHVDGLRKYPDLGNEYYAKEAIDMIESLDSIRGFLHDNDASTIKL